MKIRLLVETLKTIQLRWLWIHKNNDRQQTTEEDIYECILTGQRKKGRSPTNLGTGYGSNNERTRIGRWSLGKQR